MRIDARGLAGTGTTIVAALCLVMAAYQVIAFVLGVDSLNGVFAGILLLGLSSAFVAAHLKKDSGVLLRLALFPTNFASAFLVFGTIDPEFFGRRTPVGIALFSFVLLLVGVVASFKSQLKSRLQHELKKP